jgi:hypothetical protein
MYRPYWKRKPNKNYHIGQKTNGSTIVRITMPDTSEAGMRILSSGMVCLLKRTHAI